MPKPLHSLCLFSLRSRNEIMCCHCCRDVKQSYTSKCPREVPTVLLGLRHGGPLCWNGPVLILFLEQDAQSGSPWRQGWEGEDWVYATLSHVGLCFLFCSTSCSFFDSLFCSHSHTHTHTHTLLLFLCLSFCHPPTSLSILTPIILLLSLSASLSHSLLQCHSLLLILSPSPGLGRAERVQQSRVSSSQPA